MLDDTIAAISTPIGQGGIGIVRLSGKDALKIVDRVFVSKNKKKPSRFKTYTVHYGRIVDSKKLIDEVILTVMRAPKTYTREDVVEINCHSGIVPLKRILDLVLSKGARLAQTGEFTKRAFLNGRIDIVQAEAVIDIIKAKTDLGLRSAVNSLEGKFSDKINRIRDEMLGISAHIEAGIDFSEDDIDTVRRKDLLKKLKQVNRDIGYFISTAYEGRILRQGIKAVICGVPNVGKSSLMNALLRESRAIVTDIPGTTRDTIEEVVNINGIPLVLIDTAGIADTEHPVEKEGIKRSHYSIQNAELVLFVLDYARPLKKNDYTIIKDIKDKENIIIVVNKMDLKKGIDINCARKLLHGKDILYVSALNGRGIDKLEERIKDMVFRGRLPASDFIGVSNGRQLDVLRKSNIDIKEAIEGFGKKLPIDIIAMSVRSAIEDIGQLTGHNITEEALDRIFSEFCIGK